jgi:hypothetical protein
MSAKNKWAGKSVGRRAEALRDRLFLDCSRTRSVAAAGGIGIGDEKRRSSVGGWASFRKPAGGRGLELEDAAALARSSSPCT